MKKVTLLLEQRAFITLRNQTQHLSDSLRFHENNQFVLPILCRTVSTYDTGLRNFGSPANSRNVVYTSYQTISNVQSNTAILKHFPIGFMPQHTIKCSNILKFMAVTPCPPPSTLAASIGDSFLCKCSAPLSRPVAIASYHRRWQRTGGITYSTARRKAWPTVSFCLPPIQMNYTENESRPPQREAGEKPSQF
jgi:alanine racemase